MAELDRLFEKWGIADRIRAKAVLVPANRFEVLECTVAIDAVAENAQDAAPIGRDRRLQHLVAKRTPSADRRRIAALDLGLARWSAAEPITAGATRGSSAL